MIVFIILLVICYLIGSVSPSIILCKARYSVDIRTLGSGNAGTTNVLRNFGKKMAAITLILDAIKGIVCYFIGYGIFSLYTMENLILTPYQAGLFCGLAGILGHIFPIYYGFKGGKGVATTLGLCLVAAPKAALVAVGVAIIIMAISRRISLGSLLGILTFTVSVAVLKYGNIVFIWAAALTVIIWIKHWENIKRLVSGTEPKFSLKK